MRQASSPHHSRQSVRSPREALVPLCRFTLQVRLRSEFGPACEISCTGLEEAIRFSESEFPAFAERNPWIGLDSLQGKIWILLDPETEDSGASNA